MKRLCKHCGKWKDEQEDFYPGRLYLSSRCKECERKRACRTAKKRQADPNKGPDIRVRRRERESLEEVKKRRRELDRDRHHRDWGKRRKAQADYFQKNKGKVYVRVNARLKTSPPLRLRKWVSNGVRMALQAAGGSKRGRSVMDYLPYGVEELRTHLESLWEPWMDWSNWGICDPGRRTWQIDHVTPQAALPFDDFGHPNFLKCWSLSNLRPLESSLNLEKGCSRMHHLFHQVHPELV